ncbi:ABC-type glycerol-3-phosphate transport system substrate-binding protein [Kitasatospora sp. MAA19]|uniref:hypothetical protein n=1 Tax=Kitasatospora sp. MAA19 TaxID=3035090 RepID=UPI002476909D|nr:hypothetical protein [Kitasatospora sp. MAA19]MDH6708216.1 ABC-type glycerol-3-phosphate transport system substrate-binding protein [Kitasatospora sp. MAA19]
MRLSLRGLLAPTAALSLATVLGLAACSTGQASSNTADAPVAPASGKISITYLQK